MHPNGTWGNSKYTNLARGPEKKTGFFFLEGEKD